MSGRTVRRASKYGFCSGVRIADLKVRRLAAAGGRGSVLGQLVHNERVVAEMESLGFPTVSEIEAATAPAIVFSAHGVPPSYHQRARAAGLEIVDTTCKFVYDIHHEAARALAAGCHLVFIGQREHREVIGYTRDLDRSSYHIVSTMEDVESVDWSCYPKIKVFFQTTLNADDFEDVVRRIEERCADVQRADTICYATKQNQDAARSLARDPEVDLILVVGGTSSANTRHLWEICRTFKPSYLVQGPDDLEEGWFRDATVVGVTAGASTPDYVIDEVEARIAEL
jgi:(E)-4-hydroxy-3-methyl-but-2-enyl pyrophosphate reductase